MFTISNYDEVFPQENPQHHPWERFIKNAYANRIKTAHNSINNPHYPVKKEKPTDKPIERVKFTVIGNRVTEEFIFCINLVKGLYKYRKKHFESPVIRGVTSVDWPHIWNDLKIQYGGVAYCLTSQVVVFLNDKIIGGEKELKELIEQKYTYHLSLDYYHESVAQFANFIKGSGRPTVYMHMSINEEHIGTMIFMLYSDVVPYTCENFLRFCKAKKGGYSGTPVHRIVKDGWIQCGGFGLKSTELDCENFIVPPDKRGILCMANAGRHVDCSTQFLVLLQPSPWMLHKYVAFGQLIDGDATLRKIENVETWYESPTKKITIYQAGILNIDCQDIMVNRGALEYIHGHIEDLFALGEILWEEVIARVFLEIQIRENALLKAVEAEEEPATRELNLHATTRFMKKGTAPNMAKSQKSKSQDESKSSKNLDEKLASEDENNDFDVSEYQYEAEEFAYKEKQLISVKGSESIVVKPEKPYYIPLADVPYPGEVSSEYDLKKVLKGDYCLESDLGTGEVKEAACMYKVEKFPAEFFEIPSRESSNASEKSLDSVQEAEIKQFLKHHTDSASFAGDVVRGISKAKHDHLIRVLSAKKYKATLTDDELRHIKIAQMQSQVNEDKSKKVSLFVPSEPKLGRQIKRRQTGFVLPGNWKRDRQTDNISDDSGSRRTVRMDPSLMGSAPTPKISRRPTAYLRPGTFETCSDIAVIMRRSADHSVLLRLLDDLDLDESSSPTLKGFKAPASEQKSVLLTRTKLQVKSDISETCEHYRPYLAKDTFPTHEKKQHPRVHAVESPKNSLRAVAYAKSRPTMSVAEYKKINRLRKERPMDGSNDENRF